MIENHAGAGVGTGCDAEANIAAETYRAIGEVKLGMDGALVGTAAIDDVVVVVWSVWLPLVVGIGAAINGHDAEGIVEGTLRISGED